MDIGIGISLHLSHGVTIEIDGGSLFVLWLQILYVNLSRDTLVTVAYRR